MTSPLAAVAPHAAGAYRDALEHLFARTTGGSRYGLERTRALLAEIGDPHLAVPVFHVAGTNGKGSTVATLNALLTAKGLRVGRYTSPHLVDFRERIVLDGKAISEDDVVAFVRAHAAASERLGTTFFEFTTAMAFAYFASHGADVVIAETGLGGRLDSTNVARPVVAGVTEIGFDHTDILGDTLELIAREKAGIYKPATPAVVGAWNADVWPSLAGYARASGATPVRVVAEETTLRDVRVVAEGIGTRFEIESPFGRGTLTTPLLGRFQAQNTTTAITMLDAAGERWRLPWDAMSDALARVRLPGRFQHVDRWLFDVAHNPDGARVLAETLLSLEMARPITALVAVLADKDWGAILSALAPAVDSFVLTTAPTAPSNRVWDPSAALAYAHTHGWRASLVTDFDAALAAASSEAGTTLIAGSFHTVGDAMARLQVDPLAG